MIQLLPEPKMAEDFEKTTININAIYFCGEISDELRKLARERFWNYQDIKINEAYNIVKSKEEITQLTKDYLPDVSAETTAKQLADDYLHGISDDRWHAGNGI